MKKMKSIFKTLLCLVLVFVLVSCSANKMSFDSNGDVVQSKPYDVVWNGF